MALYIIRKLAPKGSSEKQAFARFDNMKAGREKRRRLLAERQEDARLSAARAHLVEHFEARRLR